MATRPGRSGQLAGVVADFLSGGWYDLRASVLLGRRARELRQRRVFRHQVCKHVCGVPGQVGTLIDLHGLLLLLRLWPLLLLLLQLLLLLLLLLRLLLLLLLLLLLEQLQRCRSCGKQHTITRSSIVPMVGTAIMFPSRVCTLDSAILSGITTSSGTQPSIWNFVDMLINPPIW